MLAILPNLRPMSAQTSGKENPVSEPNESAGFSEHLTGKPLSRSETEQSDSTGTTGQEPQSSRSDELIQKEGDAVVVGEENADVEFEPMFAQQQREPIVRRKALNELHYTQLVESQEIEPTTPTVIEEISIPSSGIENGEKVLAYSSEPGADVGKFMPRSELTDGEATLVPASERGFDDGLLEPTSDFNDGEGITVPTSEPPVDAGKLLSATALSVEEATLVPSSEVSVDDEVLVPASKNGDKLAAASTQLAAAIQYLISGEKPINNAVSQTAATGSGLVKETKLHGEKNTRPGLTPAANLQTPIAVNSAPEMQNPVAQRDAPILPNAVLSQERNSSPDVDLEKTMQSLEVKTPSTSVSPDSSVQKLSADANVPNLSQPSQTLVRAIQENSNWTKVLSSSSIQVEEAPKVDGTVLQKLDIHLNLTTLGKLDVKLRIQQGELQVQIRTDSEQTFKMLSTDQDMLENTIRGLGYKVDTIAISGPRPDGGFQMNNSSQMQGQQHSAEQQHHNEKSGQRADRDAMLKRDTDNETQSPSSSVIEHGAADVDVI